MQAGVLPEQHGKLANAGGPKRVVIGEKTIMTKPATCDTLTTNKKQEVIQVLKDLDRMKRRLHELLKAL